MKKLLSFFLALMLMLGLAMPASAAKAKAVTMRVQLVEGSVTIKDASGVTLEFSQDMRIYSGYSIVTGDMSYAYISLDDAKAIKLDMNTSVTIKKSGKKLQVKLLSGQLFFNVTTPLSSDEELEIRTSTMVTGVRGSSGAVRTRSSVPVIYATGKGNVYQLDGFGVAMTAYQLRGGQMLTLSEESDAASVVPAQLEDIPAGYLDMVAEDEGLQQSIDNEGNYSSQDLIAQAVVAGAAEQAAHDEAAAAVVTPPTEETVPAFSKASGSTVPDSFGGNAEPIIPREPKYSITWMDGNTVIQTDYYEYGKPVYRPTDPEKTGYTFTGWDEIVPDTMPEQNLTFHALWSAKTYTVTFVDDDDRQLSEPMKYEYGTKVDSIMVPPDPSKGATAQYTYTFTGWDSEISTVTEDKTYKATYSKTVNQYTITFLNENGEELQSSKVAYGETPVYSGPVPTKAADDQDTYTFAGWDSEITEVTGAKTYTATYSSSVNEYTIRFLNEDGTVLQSGSVAYGTMPEYTKETPTKAATAQYTYTFAGWDSEIIEVTGAKTYTATYSYSVNEYTIRFLNEDGTELQSGSVAYGATPEYTKETPTKAGNAQYTYTFNDWDKDIAEVTAAADYTATYTSTVNKYTIRFLNEDGTELQSGSVAYGATPEYTKETPTKAGNAQYTYTFNGWDKEIAAVTGEATYTATYDSTVNEYTVKFVNWDGTELQSGKVAYGETPVYTKETPTKEPTAKYTYTFNDWDTDIAAVTGEATYTATYDSTVNKYTIKFVNWDGTELQSGEVAYDETPEYSEAIPTRANDDSNTYTFSGWDPAISTVTGETTYTAQYSSEPLKIITITVPTGVSSITVNNQSYSASAEIKAVSGTTITVNDYALADGYVPGPATSLTVGGANVAKGDSFNVSADTVITVKSPYLLINALPAGDSDDWEINIPSAINSPINDGERDGTLNADLYIMADGELTIYATMTVAARVTLTNEGTLTVYETGTLNNYGTITNEDKIIIADGGELNNYSTDTLENNGTLINGGSLTNADGGRIVNGNKGLLINEGTLTFASNSIVQNDGTMFCKSGSSDSIYNSDVTVGGSGTVHIIGGRCTNNSLGFLWYLEGSENNYELTILGTGAMPDYTVFGEADSTDSPWDGLCNEIVALHLDERISAIGTGAFLGTNITSVTIPDSVTSIGDYAFCKCYSLETVTFGSGVSVIGAEAFEECSSLTSVTLPDSVQTIETSAFNSCGGLQTVTAGKGLTEIGEYAFCNCTSLTLFNTYPASSLTTILSNAFENCSSLPYFNFPASITTVGDYAFRHCESLQDVAFNCPPPEGEDFGTDVFENTDPGFTIGYYPYVQGWAAFGDSWNGYHLEELQTSA